MQKVGKKVYVMLHKNINSEKCSNDHTVNLESFEFEAEMFSAILLSKNKNKKDSQSICDWY